MLKKIPWILVAVIAGGALFLGVQLLRARAANDEYRRERAELQRQFDVSQWTVGQLGGQLGATRKALDRATATADRFARDYTQLVDANRRITDRLANAGAAASGAEEQGSAIAKGLGGDLELARRGYNLAVAVRDAVDRLTQAIGQDARSRSP